MPFTTVYIPGLIKSFRSSGVRSLKESTSVWYVVFSAITS